MLPPSYGMVSVLLWNMWKQDQERLEMEVPSVHCTGEALRR